MFKRRARTVRHGKSFCRLRAERLHSAGQNEAEELSNLSIQQARCGVWSPWPPCWLRAPHLFRGRARVASALGDAETLRNRPPPAGCAGELSSRAEHRDGSLRFPTLEGILELPCRQGPEIEQIAQVDLRSSGEGLKLAIQLLEALSWQYGHGPVLESRSCRQPTMLLQAPAATALRTRF